MNLKSSKKYLLVVEDDEILQVLLEKYLSSEFYDASCLGNGDDLPKFLGKNQVDLIVLDVILPNNSGIYWLKWLRQYHQHIPVIMLSAKTSEQERLLGLECGARDYVIKPFQFRELLIRIENILGSQRPKINGKNIQIGEMNLDTETGKLQKGNELIKLTGLEADILKLLYINLGAAISRDEISEQIRGTMHNPYDRSIDIHINKLRRKIEDNPAEPVYIRTVRGKGYRLHIPELIPSLSV